MNSSLIQGFGLMIIGMSLVFLFLFLISVIVMLFKKFDNKAKSVSLSPPATIKTETDINQLEQAAAIAAAVIYLNSRHPSLVYSESFQDIKIKQLNWFSKKS